MEFELKNEKCIWLTPNALLEQLQMIQMWKTGRKKMTKGNVNKKMIKKKPKKTTKEKKQAKRDKKNSVE